LGRQGELFPAAAAEGLAGRQVFREIHPEMASRRVDLPNPVLLGGGVDPPVTTRGFAEFISTHGALGFGENHGGSGDQGDAGHQGDNEFFHVLHDWLLLCWGFYLSDHRGRQIIFSNVQ